MALQASVLLKNGDAHVPEGFVASRLPNISGSSCAGLNYGTLPTGVNGKAIIERAKTQL